MKVKSESEVAQPCLTPSDPTDCSPPGSSVHGIFQARVLEWGAIAFSALFCIFVIKSLKEIEMLMFLFKFTNSSDGSRSAGKAGIEFLRLALPLPCWQLLLGFAVSSPAAVCFTRVPACCCGRPPLESLCVLCPLWPWLVVSHL